MVAHRDFVVICYYNVDNQNIVNEIGDDDQSDIIALVIIKND